MNESDLPAYAAYDMLAYSNYCIRRVQFLYRIFMHHLYSKPRSLVRLFLGGCGNRMDNFICRWFELVENPTTKKEDWLSNGLYWNKMYDGIPHIF